MSDTYFLILNHVTVSFGIRKENLATIIVNADTKNNIVFFTDDDILNLKKMYGISYPVDYYMGSTIISISLDDALRIIVIGTTSAILVFSFDNSELTIKFLYYVSNTWDLNYRLYFDPIFYRVIIDFDISSDKDSHTFVDWIFLNQPGLPFLQSKLQDSFLKPYAI